MSKITLDRTSAEWFDAYETAYKQMSEVHGKNTVAARLAARMADDAVRQTRK
jgi:hypothetical protein